MPIYEYTCEQCKGKFEQLVRSMSGDAKVKCPSCGSPKTARSFSVFAVGTQSRNSGLPTGATGMCGRCGGPGPCASGY